MHELSLPAQHENCSDNRGDHLSGDFRNPSEHVTHEVHATALPRSTLERHLNGTHEASMCITADELHPSQAAPFQVSEKLGPKRFRLGITELQPQHLPQPVSCNPTHEYDRLASH